MKILFTICGRAGSKGIKNKNSKEFLGFPLPYYTISAIDLYRQKNPHISIDIVLNTDSADLIKLIKNYRTLKIDVIEREASLGLDDTPKLQVIAKSLEIMKQRKLVNYDMVVDLDITAPLRTSLDVENLIEHKVNTQADVVFSVTNSRRNPYFNMVKKTENGYVRVINSTYNSRQEAPEIFDMNASLYAYSPEFLVSGKGLFEGTCEVIKMMDTAVLDLDHEDDLELMEVIGKHLFENYPLLREVRRNIKSRR